MKKNTSTRIKATGLSNRIDFETTIDRISYIQTELRELEAERDARVQAAQTTHAELIAELQAEIKAKAILAEKYAEENRAELLPSKAKSSETPLSRYGFRLGNRSVILLKKGCSWDAAVIILKSLKFIDCVRTVEEVNKETILARTDEHGLLATSATELAKGENGARMPLSTIGLKIKQDETFYIEPKVEGGDTVKA